LERDHPSRTSVGRCQENDLSVNNSYRTEGLQCAKDTGARWWRDTEHFPALREEMHIGGELIIVGSRQTTGSQHRFWIGVIITGIIVLCTVPVARAELRLFRVTDDKQAYAREPGRYERLPAVPGRTEELYVDQKVSLTIKSDDILGVLVQKEPLLCGRKEVLLYLQQRKQGLWAPGDEEYVATFYFAKRTASSFGRFMRQESGKRVLVNLRGQTIAVAAVVGAFGGDEFSVGLIETNLDRLKDAFSSIKDRTIFK
jgi:hypothetical protein